MIQVYIGPGKYFVTSDVGRGRTQWYAFLALPEGTKSRDSNQQYLKVSTRVLVRLDSFKSEHTCVSTT
jgi:hypothetical protein